MKKVTLKQLASELGLSTSTVSRALCDNYQISTQTKMVVMEHARKLGYQVNRYARSLREGRTRTVGVVVCSLARAFMNQVVSAMYDYWNGKGYQLLVLQSRGDERAERDCISRLLDMGVDGILISPSKEVDGLGYIHGIISQNIPVVVFDRVQRQLEAVQVSSDNAGGGGMGAAYVLSKNFERVLVIGGTNSLLSLERNNGFVEGLRGLGVKIHAVQLEQSSPKLLPELQRILLKDIDLSCTDAFFATTDTLTLAVLRAVEILPVTMT